MAMCTTGSLSICATAGTDRSISTAVGGGSGSLSALSTTAGKTAPHSMLEFYGYGSTLCVNPSTINFAVAALNCCICVCTTAGNTWCYVVDAIDDTWINLVDPIPECCGIGNSTFCLSASRNSSGPERCGTICIDSSAPTVCIDVTQAGGT